MRNLMIALLLGLATVHPAGAEVVRLQHNALTLNANLERTGGDEWASGPVVLLVHGTLAHRGMEIMATLQQLLAERDISSLAINLSLGLDDRAAAMYDCAVPHRHKHTDAVDEIGAWLDWLRGQGAQHVALLGHSRGGNQAARFAARGETAGLTALVLAAPLDWDAQHAEQDYRKRYGIELADVVELARRQVAAGKGAELMDDVDLLYCENTRATADAFLSYHTDDGSMDTPLLLDRAEVPVTVFAASEDSVVPDLIGKVEPLADGKRVSLVVIDGADHFFRDLYAEDMADAIAAALASE